MQFNLSRSYSWSSNSFTTAACAVDGVFLSNSSDTRLRRLFQRDAKSTFSDILSDKSEALTHEQESSSNKQDSRSSIISTMQLSTSSQLPTTTFDRFINVSVTAPSSFITQVSAFRHLRKNCLSRLLTTIPPIYIMKSGANASSSFSIKAKAVSTHEASQGTERASAITGI